LRLPRLGAVGPAVVVAVLAGTWCAGARGAVTFTDDFNDANDAGWTRYSPLEEMGAGGVYDFPDGGYRIQAQQSPLPAIVGPGRAGSFRVDDVYSSFYTSVDVVDWNDALDQSFGFLSRVKEPGLGTTDGYAFTYSTDGPSIDISLVTNEGVAGTLASFEVVLDPAKDYRLVFEGDGPTLTGSVFDLADLSTPVASVTATDSVYPEGINGVFVFDNSGGPGTADATFDNYVAAVPEPGAAGLLAALAAVGLRRQRRSK
jgi:hypothetical protein